LLGTNGLAQVRSGLVGISDRGVEVTVFTSLSRSAIAIMCGCHFWSTLV